MNECNHYYIELIYTDPISGAEPTGRAIATNSSPDGGKCMELFDPTF